jgi:hypothetical protein
LSSKNQLFSNITSKNSQNSSQGLLFGGRLGKKTAFAVTLSACAVNYIAAAFVVLYL